MLDKGRGQGDRAPGLYGDAIESGVFIWDRVESVPTGLGGGAVRLLTAPHLSKGGAVGAEGRDFGMTLALTPGPSPVPNGRGECTLGRGTQGSSFLATLG